MLFVPAAAHAAEADKEAMSETLQIKPIVDARLRWESVDQGELNADAVTLRLRAGAEVKLGAFSLFAEGEGTVAPVNDYNAFPFPIDDGQRRPQFAVVADPQNAELNRLQLQYKSEPLTATVGRQRINLDDQRWVGSVGWRQNEQTFDAARGEAKLGPASLDLTYAMAQRTIFGEDAGPQTSFRGDFVFAGIGSNLGPVEGKLFSYVLDYDEDFFLANSSQTYGGFLNGTFPVRAAKLSLRASYARQSDYGSNPFDFAADYWSFEGGAKLAGFTLTGGWEQLGSDNGRALQTPMATLHKFNGWADLFLTTPASGLEDAYVSVGKTFDGMKLLPGLNANVVFHQFDSAVGDVEYGTEWDASLSFKIGKVGLLLKYADYNAQDFGADTRKLWLQAEWAF
ncbi:alginate export family protein [Sphingomonas lutea]|uniref:Alginate export family protein n=2 Tax=Sphingomonas lutea TaxID=1045317 RepID=A0A7G9SGA5_9SPHN|nr:alginate export family protein [Sphingomonas lutea]QNN66880.1 alginate export family protein [Sphingomonas lutea]